MSHDLKIRGPRIHLPHATPLWRGQVKREKANARAVYLQAEDGRRKDWKPSTMSVMGRPHALVANLWDAEIEAGEGQKVAACALIEAHIPEWQPSAGNDYHIGGDTACLAGEARFTASLKLKRTPAERMLAPVLEDAAWTGIAPCGLLLSGKPLAPWPDRPGPAADIWRIERALEPPPYPEGSLTDPVEFPYLLVPDCSPEDARLDTIYGSLEQCLDALAYRPAQGPALWAALKPARKRPAFYWRLHKNDPTKHQLVFAPGHWNLEFGDAAQRDERGVATAWCPVTVTCQKKGSGVEFSVKSGGQKRGTDTPQLVWEYFGAATESLNLSSAAFAFDDVAVARMLREQQGLPDPDRLRAEPQLTDTPPPDPPEFEPLVWGCMPLEDGWAQLPFPNVTDLLYAEFRTPDNTPAKPKTEPGGLLSGAALYGNDRAAVRPQAAGEHAWSLALVNGAGLSASYELTASRTLESGTVTVVEPELLAEGLLWLAADPGSARDALPGLDDWVAGLRMVPLRSIGKQDEPYKPVLVAGTALRAERVLLDRPADTPAAPKPPIAYARLVQWNFSVKAGGKYHELAQFLYGKSRYGAQADYYTHKPLLWRRHAALPCVQNLPATQSSDPPNHPAASRQLEPAELGYSDKFEWKFKRPDRAAAKWPEAVEAGSRPADWNFSMAALSLPGVAIRPAKDASWHYRHDLPYLDEPCALGTLPKDENELRSAAPPPLAPVLRPGVFEAHWKRLHQKAEFAAAADVHAIGSGGTAVAGLVLPYEWRVTTPQPGFLAYPGKLDLKDARNGNRLDIAHGSPHFLAGIEGRFEVDNGALKLDAQGAYRVVAGSLAAALDGSGAIRDQRGVLRHATKDTGGRLLVTPIAHETKAAENDGKESWSLCTLKQAATLKGTPAGAAWSFWFRDLPCKGEDGSFDFGRGDHSSELSEDNNDPEALAGARVYRTGYEWRMTAAEDMEDEGLPFGQLRFYPVSLVKLAWKAEEIAELEIEGRLQLPIKVGKALNCEQTAHWNLVKLRWAGASLAIEEAEHAREPERPAQSDPKRPPLVWPVLLDHSGATAELRLVGLGYRADELTAKQVSLHFTHHGVEWNTEQRPATFNLADVRGVDFAGMGSAGLYFKNITLELNAADGEHAIALDWKAEFGAKGHCALHAEFKEKIASGRTQLTALKAGLVAENGFGLLVLDTTAPRDINHALRFGAGALSVAWNAVAGKRTPLFPGMPIDSCSGFGAMSFRLTEQPNGLPKAQTVHAASEWLFRCAWDDDGITQGLLTGSRGRLDACYTWSRQSDKERAATSALALGGMIETANLVSWPKTFADWPPPRGGEGSLGIPVADAALRHVRHTVRMLFTGHEMPAGALAAGRATLFDLAEETVWQPVLVTEHEFREVWKERGGWTDGSGAATPPKWLRRFTLTQEVRFLRPGQLKKALSDVGGAETIDTAGEKWARKDLAKCGGAYYSDPVRKGLCDKNGALDKLAAGAAAWMIEASFAAWIDAATQVPEAPADILYLPSGAPAGTAAQLDSYRAGAPRGEAGPASWQFVAVPVLCRTVTLGMGSALPMLAKDPMEQLADELARLLASRASGSGAAIAIEEADRPGKRTSLRMDPLALDEAWLHLYADLPEDAVQPAAARARLHGALSGVREASMAAIAQPRRLQRAVHGYRRAVPPAAPIPEPARDETPAIPNWWPDRLLMFHYAGNGNAAGKDYSFAMSGLHLLAGPLRGGDGCAIRQAVNATPGALFTRNKGDKEPVYNPQPVGIALSPFSSIGFVPIGGGATPTAVLAEALGGDPSSGVFGIVAARLFEPDPAALRQEWLDEAFAAQAAPGSPRIVRERTVNQAKAEGKPVSTQIAILYRNHPEPAPPAARLPEPRAVRSAPHWQRFAEGQFVPGAIPVADASARPFELGAPLVEGVQPVHLDNHGLDDATKALRGAPDADWPNGWSGMRLGIRHTEGKAATGAPRFRGAAEMPAGAGQARRLWWHSQAHAVQFAANAGNGTETLPPYFRARAISALLPSWPRAPLPGLDTGAPAEEADNAWVSVLPGRYRWLGYGARPGVMFTHRHALQTQTVNGPAPSPMLHSGAVAIQHRWPRPVTLPPYPEAQGDGPSGLRERLLRTTSRTWGVYDPRWVTDAANGKPAPCLWSYAPFDTALLLGPPKSDGAADKMVRISLGGQHANATARATLDPRARAETLRIAYRVEPAAPAQVEKFALTDGRTGFRLRRRKEDGTELDELEFDLPPDGDAAEQAARSAKIEVIHAWLDSLAQGAPLSLRIGVEFGAVGAPPGVSGDPPLRWTQTLELPLRVDRGLPPYLGLRPVFVQFEDPEYNDMLVTPAASKEEGPLKLVLDRRAYNPDSPLHAALFGGGGVVRFVRVTPEGAEEQMHDEKLPANAVFTAGSLATLSDTVRLRPGDTLKAVIADGGGLKGPIVSVPIVAEPVTPAVDAAFALLAGRGGESGAPEKVECVRFAWSPPAGRIELVNADDLKLGSVRRRAVFRWQAVVRHGDAARFTIQKIAGSGSTHVPDWPDAAP